MSELRFVTIGDRTYAIGLWWQVRHSGPAAKKVLLTLARKTAHELAERNEHHNIVALRSQQFGLGRAAAEPLSQSHALAGAIQLPQGQDSLLCIFCLESSGEPLWWVCAISKGIIAADGDCWHETREEAERAAHSQQQLIGGDFAIYETPAESLAVLEPLLSPERPLEPLFPSSSKRKNQIKQIIVGCSLAALILAGFFLYEYSQKQEALRELRLSMNAKMRYQQELQEHPERIFSMNWQNVPLVTHAGRQCADAILDQPMHFMGWSLDDLVCAPGRALSVYRVHNVGAAFADLPEQMTLLTAQKTVQSLPLPTLPKRADIHHTSLLLREKVTVALYEITQALSANLESLSWEPPEQINKDDIQLTAPWQAGKFSISGIPHTAITDSVIFQALEYPGLVFHSLVYKANAHNWTIQGVAYVRL